MKYLFSNLSEIKNRVSSCPKLLLLLDYDGTLTRIVKKPESAYLNKSSRATLRELSKKTILGVISGRSLDDIKNMVGLSGIIYAGNHGLEIEIMRKKYIYPGLAGFKIVLGELSKNIENSLRPIKGAIVENKGLSASVHYRNIKNSDYSALKNIINVNTLLLLENKKIKITKGKKVFEVRPPVRWNKGKAVLKIMNIIGKNVLPVYIGDDYTDEDAFRAVAKKGITVYVGKPKKSFAEYFVYNVNDVLKFLNRINKA